MTKVLTSSWRWDDVAIIIPAMLFKTLLLIVFVLVTLNGCAGADPVDPRPARDSFSAAWQADQHAVWEIDWPAVPVAGLVTVEIWRAGGRYRFEILEAAAPALIGQTLVFDGRQAWLYNRFEPGLAARAGQPPSLAPLSELLALINDLNTARPQQATQRAVRLEHGPADEITFVFAPEPGGAPQRITWWRDVKTGLPAGLDFDLGGQTGTVRARSFEALRRPPPGLFTPLNQQLKVGAP